MFLSTPNRASLRFYITTSIFCGNRVKTVTSSHTTRYEHGTSSRCFCLDVVLSDTIGEYPIPFWRVKP